ncbi:VOC family protein [Fredinandcohnia humi]
MKLLFLYYPVKNVDESLAYYRDVLGFEESWREGEHTAALHLPGTDVRLMIEDENEGYSAGGMFLIDSVDVFYNENKDKLNFVKGPEDIPPGRYAIYLDNAGNPIRILDFTHEK